MTWVVGITGLSPKADLGLISQPSSAQKDAHLLDLLA